jgi:DNA (cytosine-5)-methyltransferase 3A
MKVLSLFDGISCAMVALKRAKIDVEVYYGAEINSHAQKVSAKNYPDIKQLGDVRDIKASDLPTIDLLIGGSPCIDLSIAKKGREGLKGNQSSLFWEYVRIKNEVRPTWFILENVASMPNADRDEITSTLGVQPILLNASLVSAQSRKRLFWTNIPNITLPEDRGILLKHILQPEDEVDGSMFVDARAFRLTASQNHEGVNGVAIRGRQVEGAWVQTMDVRDDHKANAVTQSHSSKLSLVKLGNLGEADTQGNRVYSPDGKSATLSANGGGLGAKTGLYAIGREIGRRTGEDGKRDDANEDLPYSRRVELRTDQKTGTLTSVLKDNIVVNRQTFAVRKLTPVECERLQGLPDNYTEGIPKTHRYKCLGNAFNVDIIAHILSFLPCRHSSTRGECAFCRFSSM